MSVISNSSLLTAAGYVSSSSYSTSSSNNDSVLIYGTQTISGNKIFQDSISLIDPDDNLNVSGTSYLNNLSINGSVTGLNKTMVDLGNVTNSSDTDKPVSTAQQTALNLKANIASPTFTGTVTGITKSMVGLPRVTNTSDMEKPVSTTQQDALDLKANSLNPIFTGTVVGITKSMVGLGNVIDSSDLDKPVSTAQQTALNLKANSLNPIFTGTVVGITKSMVDLGNVTNSSDSDKPVSTAQQTALNLKANIASPTFTGTVTGITKSMVDLSNVDNTSDANKSISNATQTALNLKANIASPTFTGTVFGITKSMVGLPRVTNTTDMEKPVSTAQQDALDLKANSLNPIFTGTVTGLNKTMVGLENVDNTSDLDKDISNATQAALDPLQLKTTDLSYDSSTSVSSFAHNLSNPVFNTREQCSLISYSMTANDTGFGGVFYVSRYYTNTINFSIPCSAKVIPNSTDVGSVCEIYLTSVTGVVLKNDVAFYTLPAYPNYTLGFDGKNNNLVPIRSAEAFLTNLTGSFTPDYDTLPATYKIQFVFTITKRFSTYGKIQLNSSYATDLANMSISNYLPEGSYTASSMIETENYSVSLVGRFETDTVYSKSLKAFTNNLLTFTTDYTTQSIIDSPSITGNYSCILPNLKTNGIMYSAGNLICPTKTILGGGSYANIADTTALSTSFCEVDKGQLRVMTHKTNNNSSFLTFSTDYLNAGITTNILGVSTYPTLYQKGPIQCDSTIKCLSITTATKTVARLGITLESTGSITDGNIVQSTTMIATDTTANNLYCLNLFNDVPVQYFTGNTNGSTVPRSNIQDQIDTKADIESPNFIGNPTCVTQDLSDNSTKLATTEYVKLVVSDLVNGANSTLDTLSELAAALGNDPNLSVTLTNLITEKVATTLYDADQLIQNDRLQSIEDLHIQAQLDTKLPTVTYSTDKIALNLRLVLTEDKVREIETLDFQSQINTKVDISLYDTNQATQSVRFNAIETKDTTQDGRLLALEIPNFQSQINTKVAISLYNTDQTTQGVRFNAIETKDTAQDGRLLALETPDFQSQINTKVDIFLYNTDQTTQDDRLNAIETKDTAQDGRLLALETPDFQSQINSKVSSSLYNTDQATQDGRLLALETPDFQSQINSKVATSLYNTDQATQDEKLYALEALNIQSQINSKVSNTLYNTDQATQNDRLDAVEGKNISQDSRLDSIEMSDFQTQVDLKAPLLSPTFTGVPLAPTASNITNTNQLATTAYVKNVIGDLIGTAGATYDTLGEIATILQSNVNGIDTLTTSIGTKVATSLYDTDQATQDSRLDAIENSNFQIQVDSKLSTSTYTTTEAIQNGRLDTLEGLNIQTQLDNKLSTTTYSTTESIQNGRIDNLENADFQTQINAKVSTSTYNTDISTINGRLDVVEASGGGGGGGGSISLNNTELTGIPIAPTAINSTNTTQLATTAFVKNVIGDLIGTAGATYDTLGEIATILADNVNGIDTLTTAIATKLSTSAYDSDKITIDANIASNTSSINTINSNISNVNNTSDENKPVSTAQQTALNLKLDTLNGVANQIKNITEKITAQSVVSNAVTLDFSNGGVFYVTPASATNFLINITNGNPNSSTSTTNVITLIINTAANKSYGSTITINGTSRTLLFSNGLPSVDITSASKVQQSIAIIYSGSASVPVAVMSSVVPFY